MDNKIMELKTLFSKNNITKGEILGSFYAENLSEVTEQLADFIISILDTNYSDKELFNSYHLFLYTLYDLCENEEEKTAVTLLINVSLTSVRNITKEYNKGNLVKDQKYRELTHVYTLLKANKDYIYNEDLFDDNSEEYKIIWFVMNTLKTPDYLFRLLQINPDYANLRDSFNNHIFVNLITNYIALLGELNEDDKRNYKRIITLLLESDNLKLSNEELYGILSNIESNLAGSDISKKRDLLFISNEIEQHYEVINSDARITCQDYCNTVCPKEIINRDDDERVDLTNLFTFSIDSLRGNDLSKILIDDAVSFESTIDGVILYIHIPDVDFYVQKDSETDKYMRGIGESVYAKGYKTPMLNYDIAKNCSLMHGVKRPAITFKIKLDFDGNVKDINFMKSIINVNYNLSRSYAEMFYSKSQDATLKKALHIAKHYATVIRKKRGETIGKIKMSSLVMEEFNVLADMVVAEYFKDQGIVFPYKNYLGKRSVRSAKHVSLCEEFNRDNDISPEGRNMLYSIFDIYNRVYYDTKSLPNSSFNGNIAGNVGNPMREYISLETDRLIKDLIIQGQKNTAYWEDRIERDCIEYTETSSKIKELYGKSR